MIKDTNKGTNIGTLKCCRTITLKDIREANEEIKSVRDIKRALADNNKNTFIAKKIEKSFARGEFQKGKALYNRYCLKKQEDERF